MKKATKIFLIIFLSLVSIMIIALIAFYALVFSIEKENDKLVEQYQGKTITISDIESFDKYFAVDSDLKESIKSCEAFFTPVSIIFTVVKDYYGSGELTVTEDYYDKMLKKYDDWKLVSGFPHTDSGGYFEGNISERADDNFLDFIQNEKYFYSEKQFHSYGWLILLSQEKGKMFFFTNKF